MLDEADAHGDKNAKISIENIQGRTTVSADVEDMLLPGSADYVIEQADPTGRPINRTQHNKAVKGSF